MSRFFDRVVLASLLACAPARADVPHVAPTTSTATSTASDSQEFARALEQYRELIAASATKDQAQVIRAIGIRVAPDVIQSHNARSFVSGGRQIEVALSLLYELSLVADAQYVERVFGVNGLLDAYFRHFLEAFTYEKRRLRPIEEFAHLDESSRQKFRSPEVRQHIEGWVEHALLFVLAHELGHHVENAFYAANDSEVSKQQKERLADQWAANALIAAGFTPIHGTMLVTELLEYQERFIPAGFVGSHPPTPDRVLDLLQRCRAGQRALYRTPRYSKVSYQTYLSMEDQWTAELTAMAQRRSQRTIVELQRRAANGDVEANYALAYDYLYGVGVLQDRPQAMHHFEAAAENGEFPAQATLGSLYMGGQVGPPDFARAQYWSTLAARVGEKAALTNLTILRQRVPADSLCPGGCVAAEQNRALLPCVEKLRAGCVEACVTRYGHSREDCVARYCNELSDERRYFAQCYAPPPTQSWEACATSCKAGGSLVNAANVVPKIAGASLAPVSGAGADSSLAVFGGALRTVVASARSAFEGVKGSARPRAQDDDFTEYRVGVALPSLEDCFVMVHDDTQLTPSYTCTGYHGQSEAAAQQAYRALVQRLNGAGLSAAGERCVESTRHSGGAIQSDTTECRYSLDGVGVRADERRSTFVKSGRTTFSVDLWVSAPSRD